jgi:hypothetical protein
MLYIMIVTTMIIVMIIVVIIMIINIITFSRVIHRRLQLPKECWTRGFVG